jgi:hypothetical protein
MNRITADRVRAIIIWSGAVYLAARVVAVAGIEKRARIA